MSKKVVLVLSAVFAVLLFSAVLPALAATNNFTGTLLASNPAMTNRFLTGCGGVTGAGTFYYQTFTVSVSQAGDYVYSDIGYLDSDDSTIDSYVAFFPVGGFNPASPLAGCVDSGDDSAILTLGQGNYTMVVTTFSSDVTGNYIFSITGPGEITYADAACSNPLPAGSAVYSVPAGAPTFYAADLSTQTTFALPAGTWWISQFSGDFARVWIACQANSVWIPANAVAR